MRFLTAGESHGPGVCVILDGIPSGLPISKDDINLELKRRQRGFGAGPRMKLEEDSVNIIGGVMGGQTNGAPIAMMIQNNDHEKWKNRSIEPFFIPRPGHVDLVGVIKYDLQDIRPALERASARETVARVAMGAVCKKFLAQFGIRINGYVISIGEVKANVEDIPLETRFELAEKSPVCCPDTNATKSMVKLIKKVIADKDTLGGIIEILGLNIPPGIGSYSQWDQRLDARLGMALMSVQAIKGVEIGPAFNNTYQTGSNVQDWIYVRDGNLYRKTNNAGGLEAGVTNGETLVLRAAMKPIATTLTPQRSVDLVSGEETDIKYERSDFCPVPRAVPVLEAMVSYIITDALLDKIGGDSINEMHPRFQELHQPRLSSINLDGTGHIFWQE